MIANAWYVMCDICGGNITEISCESPKDARSIALFAGYTRVSGKDVCWVCSEKNPIST